MNALIVYLRFLRPVRSLLVVAICTVYSGSMWGQNVLHLDPRTAWFMALVIALPLLLGFFIAGAAHEPMHRPFALVLPNLRRRQRRAAAVSVLIAAVAATCGAMWVAPAVSPFATFGLACALIALPCVDRRQQLGGLAGGIVAILSWLLLGFVVGAKLGLALNAAPWLFLLGGLTISAGSLVQGFSRGSQRSRAGTLFVSYQTGFCSLLFRREMLARWQAEVTANRNRQKGRPSAPGRDWPVCSVGNSSLDWIKVLWHANFGGRKRCSFIELHLRLAVFILIFSAVVLGLTGFFLQKEYWGTLVQLAAPDFSRVGPFVMFQPGMAMLCALMLLPQQLAYPLSRERLARVVFWQAVSQWAAALVVPTASIFLVSLIGQAITGQFLPAFGLTALCAIDLVLAMVLPLVVVIGTLRLPGLRIAAGGFLGFAILMVLFARPHWNDTILTMPGILGVLAATAATQWLLWHRLHRQYATSDLVLGTGLVNPLSLGTLSSR